MSKKIASKTASKTTASKMTVKQPTDAEVLAHMERKAKDKAEKEAAAPKGKGKKPAGGKAFRAAVVAATGGDQAADRLGPVGTQYRKTYKGQEIVAKRIAERGFTCPAANPEAPDVIYESLTSVVRAITGASNPNGPGWFGLASGKKEARAAINGAALLVVLRLMGAFQPGAEIAEEELNEAFSGDDSKLTAKVKALVDTARGLLADNSKLLGRAAKVLDARLAK
jgi:hypothetical protein